MRLLKLRAIRLIRKRDRRAKAGTTILGLMVAVAITAESILHYRERMPLFSKTVRTIESELNLFRVGAQEYRGKSEDEAFQLLVERCESALTAMKESTLAALTRTDESSHPS